MKTMILASTALAFGVLAGAAHAAPTVLNGEGSSLATPTYNSEFGVYNPTNSAYNLFEYSTSSGKGQAALLNNAGTASSGVPAGLPVYWAASDSYVVDPTATNPGSTLNNTSWNATDLATDGQFIQIPMIGTPITSPYKNNKIQAINPSTKAGREAGGSLILTDNIRAASYAAPTDTTQNDLCGIYSGKVNAWSGIQGAVKQGATGAFNVVYRADNSGTTFLLTQHLGAVCDGVNDNGVFSTRNGDGTVTGKAPSQTFTSFFTAIPGNFQPSTPTVGGVVLSGSPGEAAQINADSSVIGYLSPDFTGIALIPAVNYNLPVASVKNSISGRAYQPDTGATLLALTKPTAGDVNLAPPATQAAAATQTNWVPQLATVADGYAVVGYTNWLLPTCFKTKAVASTLNSFLSSHFSGKYNTQITNGGFVIDPTNFTTAIKADFLGNSSGYNLNLENATACKGHTGR